MADLNRREFLKAGLAAGALAAAGCVPPPDTWRNEEKRAEFYDKKKAYDEARAAKRRENNKDASAPKEEAAIKDWEDNSRIEVQPFLEEEVRTWAEALAAQKYYRRMERRFEFYGSYGGYKSFNLFIKEHPQLKKNSDIFLGVLKKDGDTEKDVIKGIQAPPEYQGLINRYAGDHEQIITAMMAVESRFNPEARGSSGEIGLMQVKPETAAGYHIYGIEDPEKNTEAGTRHFKWNLKHLDNEWLAMAGYNAGLSRVQESLLPALPQGAKPIDILRRMKVIQDFPETTRDYLIKNALALDYIDEQDAQSLAANPDSVQTGIELRNKYNQ